MVKGTRTPLPGGMVALAAEDLVSSGGESLTAEPILLANRLVLPALPSSRVRVLIGAGVVLSEAGAAKEVLSMVNALKRRWPPSRLLVVAHEGDVEEILKTLAASGDGDRALAGLVLAAGGEHKNASIVRATGAVPLVRGTTVAGLGRAARAEIHADRTSVAWPASRQTEWVCECCDYRNDGTFSCVVCEWPKIPPFARVALDG